MSISHSLRLPEKPQPFESKVNSTSLGLPFEDLDSSQGEVGQSLD